MENWARCLIICHSILRRKTTTAMAQVVESCECCNIVIIEQPMSCEDNPKLRHKRNTLHSRQDCPRSISLQGFKVSPNSEHAIHQTRPAGIGIHSAENCYAMKLSGDCYNLVCRSCRCSFRIFVKSMRAFIQQQPRVPEQHIRCGFSLLTDLPLLLRQFCNFDTHFLSTLRRKMPEKQEEEEQTEPELRLFVAPRLLSLAC